MFSHGAGDDPRGYRRLYDLWTAAGITVIAPVYVDSLLNPDRGKYTLAAAFVPRWRDLTAVVAYARSTFPGMKVAAAGHSYGSLFSLMMAGALPTMFGPPKAPVDAVVAFASPGKIQPLVHSDSYAGVAVPFLQITGDHDVVPGLVSDWHEHLIAYETSAPGDKYLWVGKGVDHNFGGAFHREGSDQAAALEEAARISTDFLRAYLLDSPDAKARLLASAYDPALGQFSRR